MESVLFVCPRAHEMFEVHSDNVAVVRPWAFHQGIYNLFLALAMVVGVIAGVSGHFTVARTLLVYAGGSMVAAAVALFAFDPRRGRLPGLVGQGIPALLALLAVLATA